MRDYVTRRVQEKKKKKKKNEKKRQLEDFILVPTHLGSV